MTNRTYQMTKNDIILNLKEALNSEYKALDGYEDFLRLIEDKVDRNIIEMIIIEEREHIKIAEALIDMVNQFGK